ncbi:hypothetical protein EXIGLDRAFT_230649 [Exidia glandulosa HHB12029]|uniref:Uncharacterized protein n=1 Tax=Exidia glandulosa HHB12029 TaxID=1314781 RepID=A0A165E5P4_EXIGL|nr:hypothetical protein EXIGLDRAFT_230649 [Exidia glandulosa HHB12029]
MPGVFEASGRVLRATPDPEGRAQELRGRVRTLPGEEDELLVPRRGQPGAPDQDAGRADREGGLRQARPGLPELGRSATPPHRQRVERGVPERRGERARARGVVPERHDGAHGPRGDASRAPVGARHGDAHGAHGAGAHRRGAGEEGGEGVGGDEAARDEEDARADGGGGDDEGGWVGSGRRIRRSLTG